MTANFQALLKNIKTLLLLLLKDITQSSFKETLVNIDSSTQFPEANNDQINSRTESDLTKTSDEDSEISEFSQEVIQLIEEEEQKVA